jgi:hypothetical protein
MPEVLATKEAAISRIMVGSQTEQTVRKTLSRKKPITKKGCWSGLEFKPQQSKKKTKTRTNKQKLYDWQNYIN